MSSRLLLGSIIACVAAASPALAQAPATASATAPTTAPAIAPAARTNHDLLREIVEFDLKHVVEAYEKHGHRDPKWDEAATKLVRAQYEASIHNNDLGGHYTPVDGPAVMPIEQRVELAEAILDAGCDDAMVLYLAAHALLESPLPQPRCGPAFMLADQHAADSKYLPLYKMLMVHNAMLRRDPMEEGDPELVAMRERFRALLRRTLSDRETLPKYRAVVWEKADWIFKDNEKVRADRIATAVADVRDADPWLFDTYMGHVEIQRAWMARGGGWANTVTDAGWKGFAAHLANARQRLERASKLDPALPHAPALLITVALGEGSGDGERWFREATRRQLDHHPAYINYRSIVQPRWGGSVAQQLALANAAVDTGRFDTRAPSFALDVIDDLERDAERPLTVAELQDVAPIIHRAMLGYSAPECPEHIRNWANATRVVWHYVTDEHDEARRLLDTVPALENGPVAHRNIEPRELLGHVYALTGPKGKEVAEAMATTDAQIRAAMLAEIAATLGPDEQAARSIAPKRVDSGLRWVKRRLEETRFEASLQVGKWTPLSVAPDLAGWTIEQGTWRADGADAIVGTSDKGLNIIAPFQMPERFEFRCTVEPVGAMSPRSKMIYVFPAWSPNHPVGGHANLSEGRGMLIRDNYNNGVFPLAREGDRATLWFRYEHGELTALDEMGNPLASKQMPPGAIRRPAFGGLTLGAGKTWRFSEIAVRAIP